MKEPFKNVESIFLDALNLSEEARGAFLDGKCGIDTEFRAYIEHLLRAHGNHDAKVEGLLMSDMEGAIHILADERSGENVGRYLLKEKIGEGSVGVVYLADQLEPVQRPVAVKVIKLGMDTLNLIERFETERQALALMDHPNIARVYDAGSTEQGRPFFVMELVRGIPLSAYCDRHKLSLHRRLELFVEICQAVQHAHQKGIVHRDLKPANILVADDGGTPIPKIIDFGIAKAIEGRMYDPLKKTHQYTFIGTPVYSSPEQAHGNSQGVDTRSDIYSLGMILYEMLTGVLPFDPDLLKDKSPNRLYDELQQTLILAPSTVLRRLSVSDRNRLADFRTTNRRQHYHQLSSDLDWIIMRCLESEKERRYETANALAMDIKRYLQGDPVSACPPSKTYLLKKFVLRHKIGIICKRSGGRFPIYRTHRIPFSLQRERVAREQTKKQADHLAKVTQLLNGMLEGVDLQVKMGRDTLLLSGILKHAIGELESDPAPPPEVEADLREILGKVYFDLGQRREAIAVLTPSLEIRTTDGKDGLGSTFRSLVLLGRSFFTLGKLEQAEEYFRQALAFAESQPQLDALEVVKAKDYLSDILVPFPSRPLLHSQDLDEAIALRRESVQTYLKEYGPDDVRYAESLIRLALTSIRKSNTEGGSTALEAENYFVTALDILSARLGRTHPEYAIALLTYGLQLTRVQSGARIDQALALLEQSTLEMDASSYGKLVANFLDLGSYYFGRSGRTERLLLLLVNAQEEYLGQSHPENVETLICLGKFQDMRGRFAEAEDSFKRSLALAEQVLESDHPTVLTLMSLLATNAVKLKKFDPAEHYFQSMAQPTADAGPVWNSLFTVPSKQLSRRETNLGKVRCRFGASKTTAGVG